MVSENLNKCQWKIISMACCRIQSGFLFVDIFSNNSRIKTKSTKFLFIKDIVGNFVKV